MQTGTGSSSHEIITVLALLARVSIVSMEKGAKMKQNGKYFAAISLREGDQSFFECCGRPLAQLQPFPFVVWLQHKKVKTTPCVF
jgi:hypothetical protein